MNNDEKGDRHFIFAVPSVQGNRGVILNESKGEVRPESDNGFLVFHSPSSLSSPPACLTGRYPGPLSSSPQRSKPGRFPKPGPEADTSPGDFQALLTPSFNYPAEEALCWQRVSDIFTSLLDNSAPEGKPSLPFWFALFNLLLTTL